MQLHQYIITLVMLHTTTLLTAQKDTLPKEQVIKVKSSFKPVLRNASKLVYYGTPPLVDSTRPTLTYTIPAQNLFFQLQPTPIKPLALPNQANEGWSNSNYVKLGYGNFSTPYLQAGLSFGNIKTAAIGIYANYISSKGTIKNQENANLGLAIQGSKTTPKGIEIAGKVGYNQDQYRLYGYDHNLYNYTKNQVKQNFSTTNLTLGFKNVQPTEYGLNYNPKLTANLFTDNKKANEINAILDVPVQKNIGDNVGIQIGAAVDYTHYTNPSTSINNTIVYIKPALLLQSNTIKFVGGAIPSWENSKFALLPNLTADIKLKASQYSLQLGWLGYFNKGSYQRWAAINPYIAQPTTLYNTKVDEKFAGIKGTSGNHIVYSIKASYFSYNNMPLFVNDTTDGKTFIVTKETSLNAIQIHAEVGVIEKEIFHLTAGVNINNYLNLQNNAKAFGLLPIEATAALQWQLFKGLWLKADAFVWDGAKFKTKTNQITKLNFVTDVNAGLEFKVTKQIAVWANGNNLLNARYQRWRNYDTYGTNFLVGFRYNFSTKSNTTKPVSE